MHEHDGDCFDLARSDDAVRERPHLGLVEFLNDGAGRPNSFVHLERIAALDERFGLYPCEIVMVTAITAADERHVAKTARGHVANHRTFGFEQRVRCNRCAEAY